jgi:hypothetical protein
VNPLDTLATLRIESGALLVDAAESWQLSDLRAILAGEIPFHFITRPRASPPRASAASARPCSACCATGAWPCPMTRTPGPWHRAKRQLVPVQGPGYCPARRHLELEGGLTMYTTLIDRRAKGTG